MLEKNTLEFIEKHNEDIYSILKEPVEPSKQSGKSDNELILEASYDSSNPKMELYRLLLKSNDALQIARKAAELHDYVTALYWHGKTSVSSLDIRGQFERLHYSACAERQKKEEPYARPITSAEQMLTHPTALGKELRDSSYPQVEYNFRAVRQETYERRLGEADAKTFQPILRKIDKSSGLGCLGAVIVFILALVLLFTTVPKVWAWSDPFFTNMSYKFFLMELFTWIVPLLYIILVVVVAFILICLCTNDSIKLEERLEKLINDEAKIIGRDLRIMTDEGIAYYAMNKGLSDKHRNYPHRLALAALADMYGEEDPSALCKLWNQTELDTWLTRTAVKKNGSENDYKDAACRLLENFSHDSDLFLACDLYMLGNKPAYSPYSNANFDLDNYKGMLYSLDAFEFTATHIHSSNGKKALAQYVYRFLLDYYNRAKANNNYKLLGEACYQMYTCCADGDIRHKYGSEGLAYSYDLILAVMRQAISRETFGYTQSDAVRYIQELRAQGDPNAEKLQRQLDSYVKFKQQQREDELELRDLERKRAEELNELRRSKLRAELNDQADDVERMVNYALLDDASSDFERNLSGKLSDYDYDKGKLLRDKAIEKKLDELMDD